jgi:two-component system sensor histidine kinase GlrK
VIHVSLEIEDQSLILEVADSGPGVSAADREKIFEPFKQGTAEYQSSVRGTGLGLAITKEYVEAHDGSVEVVECGTGARFRITLPEKGPQRRAGP